jgi:IclR family acetate operon transcriptional repressor
MEELAQRTGETVLLTVRRGNSAIVVEAVESGRGGIKLAMNRGDLLPIYSCALTRPLIAYLPDEEVDFILRTNPPRRFTPYTTTDLQEIKNELNKVRRQGYAYSEQELTIGAGGLGAPVFNHSGDVIGTLCMAGSLHHITKAKIPQFVKILLKSTKECSLKMGFKSWVRTEQARKS